MFSRVASLIKHFARVAATDSVLLKQNSDKYTLRGAVKKPKRR